MKKSIVLLTLIFLLAVLYSLAMAEKIIKPHHQANGIGCRDCHTTDPPEAVTIEQCIICHDLPEEKEDYHDGDPDKHDSPHYGPELECENCHVEHGESVNFCADCHNFNFKVP